MDTDEPQASAQQGHIARVVLHKHGMGYFERRARVTDDAELRLCFRHDEMDDVLKSLAFGDAGSGRLVSVSYDPHPELAKRVDDIRIALPERGGLVALLGQLRGAEVGIHTSGETLRGRVLGVERADEAVGDCVVPVEVLCLAVGDSLRRVRVPEIVSAEASDPALRRDLRVLLERSDASRRSERRRLSLHLRGAGEREVSVAYSVPTTVWKTTYRIVFEHDARPHLLGFAVVDNDGLDAWEGVELSLVSGLPVSFSHDLYSPRRRARPHVRTETEAPIAPPVLEKAFDLDAGAEVAAAAGACEEAGVDLDFEVGEALLDEDEAPVAAAVPAGVARMDRSVEVATRGIEQGDLFRYDVDAPVTIPSGSSALVPILSEPVEGEIVCVYNAEVREGNPITSFRLKNTSRLALEGGPATVLRGGEYAGEAMLDDLRQDEETLVPFSVELGCRITTAFDSQGSVAHGVRVAGGRLHVTSWSEQLTTYTIRNTSARPIDLWLEHPGDRQAELVDTPEPIERTERFDRFRIRVPAAEQTRFAVRERSERASSQAIVAGKLAGQISAVQSMGEAGAALDALRSLEPVAGEIAALEKERSELDAEVKAIGKQHDRIRDNLEKLGSETQKERDLRERYIDSLDRDETRLEELGTRRQEIQQQLVALVRRFAELARDLDPRD